MDAISVDIDEYRIPFVSIGRLKAIECHPKFVGALLRGGFRTNVPEDARVTDLFADPWTKNIIFIIESQSFDLVPPGEQYPKFELVLKPLER